MNFKVSFNSHHKHPWNENGTLFRVVNVLVKSERTFHDFSTNVKFTLFLMIYENYFLWTDCTMLGHELYSLTSNTD